MSSNRLFKQLSLIVCGLGLFAPFLNAAEPIAPQSYYTVQLSGPPEIIKEAWQKAQDLPYPRIEKHAGQHILRIGFWNSEIQAKKQLALIKNNFPGAFILQAEFEPNKIVQGWVANTTKQSTFAANGRIEPQPLPPNLIFRQEYARPEVLAFKDRHVIWLNKPLIKPAKKPFYLTSYLFADPARKQKITPGETRLWRLYRNEKYDALQAEIIRFRSMYPNWRPPQKLTNLLQQRKITQKINMSIRENDTAMLIYMAELYPDVFTCAHIDWAWALTEARVSLKQTSSLILDLHRLIADCGEQDRLATLYKARYWLDADQWETLVEREAQAHRTSPGETKFHELRYNHQTAKLLTTYQENDSIAFRALFLQLADQIEHYRDVDTALMGGWHYYDAQEITAAEVWFNKVLAWDSKQTDALRGLSLSAMQDKRFNDALYFSRKLPANSEVRQKILSDIMVSAEPSLSPETASIALAGGELSPGNSFAYVGAILPLPSRQFR